MVGTRKCEKYGFGFVPAILARKIYACNLCLRPCLYLLSEQTLCNGFASVYIFSPPVSDFHALALTLLLSCSGLFCFLFWEVWCLTVKFSSTRKTLKSFTFRVFPRCFHFSDLLQFLLTDFHRSQLKTYNNELTN